MMYLRCMFVALLASLPAARSIPWAGPSQTVQFGCAKDGVQIPAPTDGPKNELMVQGLKRDITVAPNTCGWVDGNFDDAWIAAVAPTCLWYSERTVVNGYTACIDYGETCSGDCSLMNTCNIVSPYCGSVYFPFGYRGYGNCNPTQGLTYNVELTYTGLAQPIDLPIFTGPNGVSTGTQYPPGESPAATATTVSSSGAAEPGVSIPGASITSATSQPGGLVQSTSSSSGQSSGGSSSSGQTSNGSSSSPHSSPPIGAIVGGVIGGLVIICGTIIAILWILRSRKKESAPVPEARFQPGNTGNTGFYPELEQPKPAATVSRPELADSRPLVYGEKKEVGYSGYAVATELPGHT